MNTAKINQLEKALDNKHITPALKSKIEDAIAKLKAEDAQREPQAKEPEPTPVPQKKSVEPKTKKASVRKPKKVLVKKETVKSESGKKQTVFQKAKEIRTDGESWASARKRASAMIGKEAKEKTAVSDSEIKKLLAKVRRSKQLRKLIGKTDIVRDAKRKALPAGKRMSKEGNVYYETRANRTDSTHFGKWYLEEGGFMKGAKPDKTHFYKQGSSEWGLGNTEIFIREQDERFYVYDNLWNDDEDRWEDTELDDFDNLDEAKEFAIEHLHEEYSKYELGGNLAGQLGGGTHVPEVMLDGNTGKDYTGLVGETGGLSSGELFEKGGGLKSNSTFRVNNSPLLEYVNFNDGSHINLVRLKTPFKNGMSYAVSSHEPKQEQKILLFKTLDKASRKFNLLSKEAKIEKTVRSEGKTDNYESGGQENAETIAEATTSYENLYLGEGATGGYAKGGSLKNHGLKFGDKIVKTLSGGVQKIKDTKGRTMYVNLADGYRGDTPPLPYKKGGITSERKFVNKDQDYEIYYAKNKPQRAGYKGNKNFKKATPDKKLFGGLSNKKPKYVGKQIMTKSNGMVQVLAYDDYKQQVQVFTVGKAGDKARWIEVSELIVDESKMEKGGSAGSSSKGDKFRAVTKLAKEIRKDGETWRSALNRAWAQSK